MKCISTSYLDLYDKDERGNKIPKSFGNPNKILAFFVNAKEIETKDVEGIQAQSGYFLMLENHGLEALFKIIKDGKVFYFAVQQQTLRLLDILVQQFESVTQQMIDSHVNKQ